MKPVISQYFETLLEKAFNFGASDLHLEPSANSYCVRLRIDGVLQFLESVPPELFESLASYIKILAKLDITEKRLPQDGRISMDICNTPLDLRVAILPTIEGELITVRILDRSHFRWNLDALGMPQSVRTEAENILSLNTGLILVTGPTGSGKTTTLYSLLSNLNKEDNKKIITVEDPVEYTLEGIQQVNVNEGIGLTFELSLKSFLRQDPNILLIGEIRDLQTAKIAIHAALTGHLVLSSLHTKDSISAIHRLLHFNIEPYLIASALHTVFAQRLLRSLCKLCKQKIATSASQKKILGPAQEFVFCQNGCPNCNHLGFNGRLGLFESLTISPEIQSLIKGKASYLDIYNQTFSTGRETLKSRGLDAVREGKTTLDELAKTVLLDIVV